MGNVLHRSPSAMSPSDTTEDGRHYRHKLFGPVMLKDWPKLKPVPSETNDVLVDCFQELDETFLGKTVFLQAGTYSKAYGCPLRVPGHSVIDILDVLAVDEELSYFQIYAGPNRLILNETSGKIRDGYTFQYGPYHEDYVLIVLKPSSKLDSLAFVVSSPNV